jgi:hypothetical protein
MAAGSDVLCGIVVLAQAAPSSGRANIERSIACFM